MIQILVMVFLEDIYAKFDINLDKILVSFIALTFTLIASYIIDKFILKPITKYISTKI